MSERRERDARGTGAFAGLALLAKGLGAGIYPIIVAPFVLYRYRRFLSAKSLETVAVTAAIALPWPLLVYLRHGRAFLDAFVTEQVIGRVAGSTDTDRGGTFEFMSYPYLRELPGNADPWIFLLPVSAVYAVYAARRRRVSPALVGLCLWWFAATLGFFMLTGNHGWYVFPVYPAVALLVALPVADATRGRRLARPSVLVGVVSVALFSARANGVFGDAIVATEASYLSATGGSVRFAVAVGFVAVIAFQPARAFVADAWRESDVTIASVLLPAIVIALVVYSLVFVPPAVGGSDHERVEQAAAMESRSVLPQGDVIAVQADILGSDGPPLLVFTWYAGVQLEEFHADEIGESDHRFAIVRPETASDLDAEPIVAVEELEYGEWILVDRESDARAERMNPSARIDPRPAPTTVRKVP